jgi:lipopolysaccharide biosynthesis regulator YciM
MGYLRIEQGSLQVAAAHLVWSLLFDTSSHAISELAYIKQEYGKDYTNMAFDEALAILVEADERVLIDERTFQALVQTLSVSMQYRDYETSLSVARELYNFTGDDTYKDIICQLEETLGLG